VHRGRRSPPNILKRAGEHRLAPTDAEARLWSQLRSRRFQDLKFRRQHAIGKYIVDFCSPSAKLVIELDGSQHLQRTTEDAERTKYLVTRGYRVLRFWNSDVASDLEGVILAIQQALKPG
jgi:very-short-patch-repair endonuclease